MTALGIPLIAIGIALVCAGVVFRPRAPQTDPAVQDGPDRFRTILDALGADDGRGENRDLTDMPAMDAPQDPAAEAAPRPGRQRRPQLG